MMVIRGYEDPTTAGQRSDDAYDEEDARPRRLSGLGLQIVLEKHEAEARPRGQGNKNLEEASFRVPVTNADRE